MTIDGWISINNLALMHSIQLAINSDVGHILRIIMYVMINIQLIPQGYIMVDQNNQWMAKFTPTDIAVLVGLVSLFVIIGIIILISIQHKKR